MFLYFDAVTTLVCIFTLPASVALWTTKQTATRNISAQGECWLPGNVTVVGHVRFSVLLLVAVIVFSSFAVAFLHNDTIAVFWYGTCVRVSDTNVYAK